MKNYSSTIRSGYIAYGVQAISNNFAPLLFLTFQSQFGIPLKNITFLITLSFIIQLLVDLLTVFFVDKIGYRISLIMAHAFASTGLVLLAVLPFVFNNHFIGILIAVITYSLGCGLLEVLVSPLVEACPAKNKEKTMGLLHSAYSWGHVIVIIVTTVFFNVVGIDKWWILSVVWAIVPLVNAFLFIKVPIAPIIKSDEKGLRLRELFKIKLFWVLVVTMICAGASEIAIAQWSSAFVEKALGLSKSISDLAGPMIFALMMGITRVIYGNFTNRISLDNLIIGSCVLCVIAYLMAALSASPILGLVGVALCGVSVGILWPGTYSCAASSIRSGGTAMFAILALGGDIGASGGPTLVGLISSAFNDDLKIGILFAAVFPVILIICMLLSKHMKKKQNTADVLPDINN